ncbi:MAG: hypothetical protein FWC96_05030 [Oscillospiraceae bacterium]|nr:hypothetical protein [Oscillospiraceae bacterium]
MDVEFALVKLDKWFRKMVVVCIIFAIVTFVLGVELRNTYNYANAVARFWTSASLTVFFGITSVTVKKIHKVLLRLDEKR